MDISYFFHYYYIILRIGQNHKIFPYLFMLFLIVLVSESYLFISFVSLLQFHNLSMIPVYRCRIRCILFWYEQKREQRYCCSYEHQRIGRVDRTEFRCECWHSEHEDFLCHGGHVPCHDIHGKTNRQTDVQIDRQTDRQTDRQSSIQLQ